MTVVVKTNPTMVDGVDWNTTTYSPSTTVGNFGGSTSEFNVVSGAVVLNGGVSISGDRGIVFLEGTADMGRVNPLFTSGTTQITYDATTDTSPNVLLFIASDIITIDRFLPASIVPLSVSITYEGYCTNATNGSGGAVVIFRNGVLDGATIQYLTTSWAAYSKTINVYPGDVIEVAVWGRTYTYQSGTDNKTGTPIYTTVNYPAYVRYVACKTNSNTWQVDYPDGIVRYEPT